MNPPEPVYADEFMFFRLSYTVGVRGLQVVTKYDRGRHWSLDDFCFLVFSLLFGAGPPIALECVASGRCPTMLFE